MGAEIERIAATRRRDGGPPRRGGRSPRRRRSGGSAGRHPRPTDRHRLPRRRPRSSSRPMPSSTSTGRPRRLADADIITTAPSGPSEVVSAERRPVLVVQHVHPTGVATTLHRMSPTTRRCRPRSSPPMCSGTAGGRRHRSAGSSSPRRPSPARQIADVRETAADAGPLVERGANGKASSRSAGEPPVRGPVALGVSP